MTWPFSAARTAAPSGASMLMPVPLDAMKSVMTLPEIGQRNLSAPDITGSTRAGLAATGGVVLVSGSTSAGFLIAAVFSTGTAAGAGVDFCGATSAMAGDGAFLAAVTVFSTGAMDATCVGAVLAVMPGMMTFWPTKIL